MTVKTERAIVKIDEEKCNGCGVCIPKCAEGALQIVDGKVKLISEKFCDGLGACLGECPQGALIVEKRMADEFDEEAMKLNLEREVDTNDKPHDRCPSETVTRFEKQTETTPDSGEVTDQASMLNHWPVKLTLVPPTAPFLQGADLLFVADCVPFTYAGFHQDFIKEHALLIACPKLDDFQAHLEKLTDILRKSTITSLTVVHMEVPCCSGLVYMVKQAMQLAGKDIPFKEVTINIKGAIKPN
ncbi:ATP-binding protein [Chloroflexota bacterium]